MNKKLVEIFALFGDVVYDYKIEDVGKYFNFHIYGKCITKTYVVDKNEIEYEQLGKVAIESVDGNSK